MENKFYIRKIYPESVEKIIAEVGFDKDYIKKAQLKYKFILIKIHNLTPPVANIIKQIALSCGADAAVHRDVITCKVEESDLLLGCTHSQLKRICEKLNYQPFGLKKLAPLLLEQISISPPQIKIRSKTFSWS